MSAPPSRPEPDLQPDQPGRAAAERAADGPLRAAKPRPRSERAMRLVQPLADRGVRVLARLGVDPQAVVWTHFACGALAAGLVASGGGRGALAAAAALLVVKALLDNMDGGLARATGRVTRMGRYLDTGLDLAANALLFAALATRVPPVLALTGFAALTGVLSLDFNLERRYREARAGAGGGGPQPPIGAPRPLYEAFRALYRLALAPQDRAVEALERARFRRLAGVAWDEAPAALRRAWADLFSTASIVDVGLTTQMLALATCLALGAPLAYVLLVHASLIWAAWVQLRRGERFRAYLAGVRDEPDPHPARPEEPPAAPAPSSRPLATVGALVFGPDGRALLVRTAKWNGLWGVPGGKIEGGETILAALRRELREETGLELRDVRWAPVQEVVDSPEFHRPARFVLLDFTARADTLEVRPNDEIDEWRWLPLADAPALALNGPTRRLVEHVLEHGASGLPLEEPPASERPGGRTRGTFGARAGRGGGA